MEVRVMLQSPKVKETLLFEADQLDRKMARFSEFVKRIGDDIGWQAPEGVETYNRAIKIRDKLAASVKYSREQVLQVIKDHQNKEFDLPLYFVVLMLYFESVLDGAEESFKDGEYIEEILMWAEDGWDHAF